MRARGWSVLPCTRRWRQVQPLAMFVVLCNSAQPSPGRSIREDGTPGREGRERWSGLHECKVRPARRQYGCCTRERKLNSSSDEVEAARRGVVFCCCAVQVAAHVRVGMAGGSTRGGDAYHGAVNPIGIVTMQGVRSVRSTLHVDIVTCCNGGPLCVWSRVCVRAVVC